MQAPELQSFNLVGGTALVLKYGHQSSIDLDLFSIIEVLQKTFGKLFAYEGAFSKWEIFCFIDEIRYSAKCRKKFLPNE